jgi:hypothetical protein
MYMYVANMYIYSTVFPFMAKDQAPY